MRAAVLPTAIVDDDSAVEKFTDQVLAALSEASWPDGSALIEATPAVLERELRLKIRAAAYGLCAAELTRHGTTFGGQR